MFLQVASKRFLFQLKRKALGNVEAHGFVSVGPRFLKKRVKEYFSLNMINKMAQAIAKTKFATKAINENNELNSFKKKPSGRFYFGIFLMVASYIIGWPMIGLLGGLSLYWNEPLMIIIGGPLLFGLAHLAFLAGLYLAGSKYLMPVIRWTTKMTLKKLIG